MSEYKAGEFIIYQNGERFQLGKIKRVTDDGAFVFYSEGDTAAKTPLHCMRKLENAYVIKGSSLGNDTPKWIEEGDELYCPACGYGNLLSLLKEIAVPFERFPRHCPHCGTELDPEGKHEHLESAHS